MGYRGHEGRRWRARTASLGGRPVLCLAEDGERLAYDPATARFCHGPEREDRAAWRALAAALADPAAPAQPLRFEPRTLTLHVATDCNLRCGYCYAGGGPYGSERRLMDRDTAARAVDLLLRSAPATGPLHVAFFGGEPLLNWPVVRWTTLYAESLAQLSARSVRFSMTTNLTLLDAAMAQFIAEHSISVLVSLDGSREQNDRHRRYADGRGCHEDVLRCYDLLVAATGRQHGARATVTPGDEDLETRHATLVALGFESPIVGPVSAPPGSRLRFAGASLRRLCASYERMADRAVADITRGRPPSGAADPILEYAARLRSGQRSEVGCGAGLSGFSVTPDGSLHACHRVPDFRQNRLGHLDGGVDARAWRRIMCRGAARQPACRTCFMRAACGGGCLAQALRSGGDPCHTDPTWCEMTRAIGIGALRVLLATERHTTTPRPPCSAGCTGRGSRTREKRDRAS